MLALEYFLKLCIDAAFCLVLGILVCPWESPSWGDKRKVEKWVTSSHSHNKPPPDCFEITSQRTLHGEAHLDLVEMLL